MIAPRKPSKRWYASARWQALRRQQLADHPLCAFHQRHGQVVPATVCDHVEAHREDEERFWDGPFQSLCKRCHDALKQGLERGRLTATGADGWPAPTPLQAPPAHLLNAPWTGGPKQMPRANGPKPAGAHPRAGTDDEI